MLKSLNEFQSYLNSAESSQSYKCPFESTKSGDARTKLFPRQTLFPDAAETARYYWQQQAEPAVAGGIGEEHLPLVFL